MFPGTIATGARTSMSIRAVLELFKSERQKTCRVRRIFNTISDIRFDITALHCFPGLVKA